MLEALLVRRLRTTKPDDSSGASGYVAVDAIIALLIIAGTLTLGLQAMRHGYDATVSAEEVRQARELTTYLLETGPNTYAPVAGRTQAFDWRLETQTGGLERPIAVCRRAVVLIGLRSHRTFPTATRAICPDEAVS